MPRHVSSDADTHTSCPISGIVIGAKCDLSLRRAVSESVARKFAHDNRMLYAECSAVSARLVSQTFSQTLFQSGRGND
jgi:hypothetical protein